MNKKLSLILTVIAMSSVHLGNAQELKYPETKKGQVVDSSLANQCQILTVGWKMT